MWLNKCFSVKKKEISVTLHLCYKPFVSPKKNNDIPQILPARPGQECGRLELGAAKISHLLNITARQASLQGEDAEGAQE